MSIAQTLAHEFDISPTYAQNIVQLLDVGNTIPFIARYRKEQTGSMDDQLLRQLEKRLAYLRSLEQRREEITHSITEQGAMTDTLSAALAKTATLTELEDLYRPFRPKRRTRASQAKEKGLEPLAQLLLAQKKGALPEALAQPFVQEEKGVATMEEALAGACDILAGQFSEDADLRRRLRSLFHRIGNLTVQGEGESVYEMYYDFSQSLRRLQNHQVLALNRGEKEGFLKIKLQVEPSEALSLLYRQYVRPETPASDRIRSACEDAYTRLIFPSLEREIRSELTDKAQEAAISVFALNLRPLLMQPPIRGKTCLALDPGYRNGCKIAVCDPTGRVLDTTIIYPTPPQNKKEEAAKILTRLIHKHHVQIIAIGNGTASKESEIFIAQLLSDLHQPELAYAMVNEAGASVYSASPLGAAEFPDFDVSIRSAVSLARRLQDPLAELVKIDPQAIGVGQYQHDVSPKALSESLKGVVEACVNQVGVDLNTASPSLLGYVAGLNVTVAKNIVTYREENGPFAKRSQLKKVPKLGPKAFEQCAGFLRIPDSPELLDRTAVHPESYAAVKKLLTLCGGSDFRKLPEQAEKIGLPKLAEEIGIGLPTLQDILQELRRPGRDIREELPPPMLRTDILELKDLKPGMECRGTVRNVTDFGAFVDIGVHQDGLVHISKICDRYLNHPSEVLSVGDVVTVWVEQVDVKKGRISLTMRKD